MSENMNETMNENEGVTVTLTLDNDETLECAVLTIYEAAGRQYIALLPLDAAADKFDEWMDSLEFDEIDLDAE